MKRLASAIVFIVISYFSIAQENEAINYQAVVRDTEGSEYANKNVSINEKNEKTYKLSIKAWK